jgi:hypothetical protein
MSNSVEMSNLRLFDVRYREVSTEKRATVDLSIGKCPFLTVSDSWRQLDLCETSFLLLNGSH